MISHRARLLKPSPTLAIAAKEKELRAQGLDIVGFGAGEPDFETPMHIKKAAIDAILDGYTKYTPAAGSEELKDAIIAKFKRDNDLEYKRDEVIVTCGGKHALYSLFQSIFEEGDEVIIPTPYWVSYPAMAELAGATPVFAETHEEEDYQLTAEILKKHITSKTKGIILNYPSNPCGSVYYLSNLEQIGKLAVENGIHLISDEIYDKIVYDGYKHTSIASLGGPIKEMTIITHAVSKTYSMTGWRIGFAAGKKEIIQAMSNIQSQSTSNPTSISQKAALAALTGPAGLGRHDGQGVQEAAGFLCRRSQQHRRGELLQSQGRLLRLSLVQGNHGQDLQGEKESPPSPSGRRYCWKIFTSPSCPVENSEKKGTCAFPSPHRWR